MKNISTSWISIALMAAAAVAQTPSNFTPSSSNHLDVVYGITSIVADTLEPVQVVAAQPSLGTQILGKETYVVLMIDPDYKTTAATSQYSTGSRNVTAIAPYYPPGPPAELPPRAHRYIQLLFRQPANLSIPSKFSDIIQKRVGFDAIQFIAETGLGPVLAANYFLVTNTSLVVATGGGTGIRLAYMAPLVIAGTLFVALVAF